MKKTAAAAITLLIIFLMSLCGASYGAPQSFCAQLREISAGAYCLIDADTYEVLCGKNDIIPRPMASTTKIMTSLIAIESGRLEETVTVDKRAVGVEGSAICLYEGERVALRDLVYAAMLASANDAALAIAYFLADDVEDFSSIMNQKAAKLGLYSASFVNPHGLPDENHFISARDLALLSAHALQNEIFKEVASTKSYSFVSDKTRRSFKNHNRLLSEYDGCIGLKTGYTRLAGRCLASAAEKNGKRLVAVTMNAPDDWNDHKRLLDFGFAQYKSIRLAEKGEHSFTVYAANGLEKSITVQNNEGLTLTVRKDVLPSLFIELDNIYYGEIKKGDLLGYAVYRYEDKTVARLALFASEDSGFERNELSMWERIVCAIRAFFERLL